MALKYSGTLFKNGLGHIWKSLIAPIFQIKEPEIYSVIE